MPTLELETRDREKPILLITGEKNCLTPRLIKHYENDFKIVYVGERNIDTTQDAQSFYRIGTNNATLIKNLEEKIDYAVISVDTEKIREIIPSLLEKLIQDNARVVVLVDVENIEKNFDIVLNFKNTPNIFFLIQGDTYSEEQEFNPNSKTQELIKTALQKKPIQMGEDQLKPLFPLYYQDGVNGINQILLGPKKSEKIFCLYYKSPQTYLSAINLLRRVEPDIQIEYKANKKETLEKQTQEDVEKLIKSKLVTNPENLDKYFEGFEKSIKHFEKNKESLKEEKQTISKIVPQKARENKKHFKFYFLSFMAAVFLFVLFNIAAFGIGVYKLKEGVNAFSSNDYKRAEQDIKVSSFFLSVSEPGIRFAGTVANIFGVKTLNTNYDIIKSASNLMLVASDDLSLLGNIFTGIDRDRLEKSIADALYIYFKARDLQTATHNQALDAVLTPDVSKMISLAPTAIDILGYDKEKNYLLLFQNNGELRPTGGFIGSIGELKLSSGKMEDIKIYDVYDYDGKLKAHVEPHYIVRRYLQPHLYLRDSNFDPDFQTSASMSALIYNLESGKKIDGVIAIDFEAVRQIIKEVGPIKLSSYNQTLDENNTFDFLQTTIDDNFFPGSTQKRDVLQALFNQLLLKLETDKNSTVKVARLFPKLMNQKHILFAFDTNSTQSIFSSNGYGGEYKDTRIKDDKIIQDFLAINEANIGVNKANINVKRSVFYNVTLKDTIESSLTTTFDNNDSKEYKSYIRIYTPLGSKLKSIDINGTKQNIVPAITDYKTYEAKNFKPPAGFEVDQTTQYDKQVFGFIISVGPKSKQEVRVIYDNGLNFRSDPVVTYSLLYIKQPGTLDYPFMLNLSYPTNYAPKEVENATLEKNGIVINKQVNQDLLLNVKLIKR